jgi:DNA-binding MarR family transcriptional regulator
VHEATLLLGNIIYLSDRFEKALANELEINSTDLDAMEHLLKDGPLRPGEIANRLEISAASASIAVDRLEAMGHVSREPHPNDGRSVLIAASPESRQRVMHSVLPMVRSLEEVLSRFREDEQATITRYLAEIETEYGAHVQRLSSTE